MHRMRVFVFVLLFAVSAFAQDARVRAFEQFAEETMKAQKMPGLSVAVVHGDFRWSRGFGFADVENEVPETLGEADHVLDGRARAAAGEAAGDVDVLAAPQLAVVIERIAAYYDRHGKAKTTDPRELAKAFLYFRNARAAKPAAIALVQIATELHPTDAKLKARLARISHSAGSERTGVHRGALPSRRLSRRRPRRSALARNGGEDAACSAGEDASVPHCEKCGLEELKK